GGDLRHLESVEIQEREPRLAEVVAAERHRPAVQRDVGLTRAHPRGELLSGLGIGTSPAIQIVPTVAEVEGRAALEDHLTAVGTRPAALRRVFDIEHWLDIETCAFTADPYAFAQAGAHRRNTPYAGVEVPVVVIEVDPSVVGRPKGEAGVLPTRRVGCGE